jgi:hypothetical protein
MGAYVSPSVGAQPVDLLTEQRVVEPLADERIMRRASHLPAQSRYMPHRAILRMRSSRSSKCECSGGLAIVQ